MRPDAEPAGVLLRALAVGLIAGAAAGAPAAWAATEAPHLLWPGPDLVQGVALRHAAPPGRRPRARGPRSPALVLALGSRWAGAARGWDILEAVVLRNGVLPGRSAIVRATSSLVTQASAGAVGREGPIVLVAAATASRLGQRLGVPPRQLRVLVGCGIAAGLACAYNTPLGAALFTMEIIFGSFALEAFAPLAVASAAATLLSWARFGHDPVFHVPPLALSSPWEIGLYAGLGVLGGVVAALFLFALRASAALFTRARLPRPVAMALAGLALGVVTLGYPEIVGNGREAIGALFDRPWGAGHVLALLLLRLVVTPLAVGSGTVGGVFTPTLFLGAMLGHAFGTGVRAFVPGLGADPAAYALVGMGCLLAGTTHAPLTSVVMVFEMTLDYGVVVPLLLGAAVASLVATRFSRTSVYTEALQPQGRTRPTRARRRSTCCASPTSSRPDHVAVAPDLPLPRLLDAFVAARRNHLYLVEADGRFAGAANLHDVNEALRGTSAPESVAGARRRTPALRDHDPGGEPAAGAAALRRAGVRAAARPGRPRVAAPGRDGLEARHPVGVRAGAPAAGRRDAPAGASTRAGGVDSLVDEVPLPAALVGPHVRGVAFPRAVRAGPAARPSRHGGTAGAGGGAAVRRGGPPRGLRHARPAWPRCGGRRPRTSLVAESLDGVEEGRPAGGQVARHDAGEDRRAEAGDDRPRRGHRREARRDQRDQEAEERGHERRPRGPRCPTGTPPRAGTAAGPRRGARRAPAARRSRASAR